MSRRDKDKQAVDAHPSSGQRRLKDLTMSQQPLVSIITPTWNRAAFHRAQLASAGLRLAPASPATWRAPARLVLDIPKAPGATARR